MDETTETLEVATAERRARARRPMRLLNVLVSMLILVFVASAATASAEFVIVFHRLDSQARTSYVTQCSTDNDTRLAVTTWVTKQLTRSKKALDAKLADPHATPLDKVTTEANYIGASSALSDLVTGLAKKDCTYPPLIKDGPLSKP